MITALKIPTTCPILLGGYLGKHLVIIGLHIFLENCSNVFDNTPAVTKPETKPEIYLLLP